MAQQATQEKKKKGSLFGDLSVAQLIAGALAAATSMLLASQIGIAGSVIGVAVGSIVSAVASQLYKRFLMVSAEKIRVLQPGTTLEEGAAGQMDFVSVASPGEEEASVTRKMDAIMQGEGLPAADQTAVLRPLTVRCSKTPRVDDETLQNDITVKRARALRERRTKLKRRVLAVSMLSGFAAVLVSASVIGFLTMGEGLGAKTSLLTSSASQSQKAPEGTIDNGSVDSSRSGQEDSKGSSSGDQSAATDNPNSSSGTESGGQQDSSGSQDSATGDSGSGGSSTGGTPGDAGSAGGSAGAGGESGSAGDTGTSGGAGGGGQTGGSGAGGDSSTSGGTTSDPAQPGTSSAASGTKKA